ncbi:MAG: TraE/TraK family type IV conjugative transfer system protein [Sulfurimonas sp.]|jgi:type IV conjugative transfer system protein TraE
MGKSFFSNWAKLKEENNVMKIVTLSLSVALVVSSIANYKLFNEKTIVVIPPKVTKEFQVTGNELSFEYIEQVGYYLSDRILSIAPENAQNSFDTIIPFLTTDPNAIKQIQQKLALQAKVVKENDIYQVFYPLKTMVNKTTKEFSVEGMLKKMSGNNYISSGQAIITFKFYVKDGRMVITSLEVK